MDAGANAAVLPAMSVASLVGFGAVVAEMPAFALVRDAVLGIGGGPLVSLAVATNVLAALTGSASGGLTIALDALGATYMARAAEIGLNPELLHRVAVIGSGTLDSLPHNGAVVTLLAVCGSTHRDSYRDIVVVGIIGALVALAAVIALGSAGGFVLSYRRGQAADYLRRRAIRLSNAASGARPGMTGREMCEESALHLLLAGRRGGALLLAILLLGVVAAIGAPGDGADHAVMAGIMTGDAADHRTLQAALGIGSACGERERGDGEQGGDRFHGGSPLGNIELARIEAMRSKLIG